ncbi:MAG: sulfite exporter TauE/SafE family protein, partial [Gaiellales bacterium]
MTTTGIELVVVFGAVGAFVQTVTGFGGALVLAPVLFATMQPAQAVLLSALLGIVQSGVLVARYSGHVLRRELSSLLAAAIPGLAVGVVVLRVAPSSVLRVMVGATVIVATIVRRLFAHGRPLAPSAALPAGF